MRSLPGGGSRSTRTPQSPSASTGNEWKGASKSGGGSSSSSTSTSTSPSNTRGVSGRDNWYGNTQGNSQNKGTFWLFRPGGGGNLYGDGGSRRPGPRTNTGYAGVAVSNSDAAKRAWYDGTLSGSDKQWWDENLPALRARLVSAGYYGKWTSQNAWNRAVEAAGDSGLTPQEWALSVLGKFDPKTVPPINQPDLPSSGGGGSGSRRGGGGGGNGGGGGGGGGGYGSTTQTRVDFTDPYTARNLINRTLSDSLGRLATEAEIKQFTAALNLAERNNPQTATSTGDSSSSSTVTAGGVDPNQVVLDQVRSGAEYEAFNTDNVFRQAMSILAGRVG